MEDACRLSVVVTSRNDDHGGGMLHRFRIFADALIQQADRHRLSGELVVVVATRSGRYDRGEDVFGLCCAMASVALGWWLWQGIIPRTGDWESGWAPALGLGFVLGLIVLGFALGAFIATLFPTLGMLFVPRGEQIGEVQEGASAAFHRFRVRQTEGATGILIYCSLLERMCWVVGDDTITAKLDDGAWFNVRDAVVDGFRARKPAEGLRTGVERAGELLTTHFPLAKGDTNELPNAIRFVD